MALRVAVLCCYADEEEGVSTPIYVKRIGQEKYHLLGEVMGDYAYAKCDQIFNMRHSDAMVCMEEPIEGVCGICRARTERAA